MNDLPESLRQLAESDLPPANKCFVFIKKAILLGYYRQGQHLVEQDLVTLLGISRSPVREAIRRLESENLITHTPHKGCVVLGLSPRDVLEMYEVRESLEDLLLRKLVEQGCTEQLRELRARIIEEHDQVSAEKGQHSVHHNFHLRLLALADHRWLNRVLGQLCEYIEGFHALSFLRQGRKNEAFGEHVALLDALMAGDLETARSVSRKHIASSLEAFNAIKALW